MAIQLDTDKVAVITRDDIHLVANLLDEVAITTDSGTRHRACERVSSLLHQLYLGTRSALMIEGTFDVMKNESQ